MINYHTTKRNVSCSDCSGYGYFKCRYCNGTGRCYGNYTYISGGNKHTSWCQNGMCPKCNGEGFYQEIIRKKKCEFCEGSRFCPTCKGTGKCKNCNGTGRLQCRTCGGKGFIVNRGD